MLSTNRWVALGMLAFSSCYGYLAFTYRLLPFERFAPMKPNTLPMGLAVAGAICALALLFMREAKSEDESSANPAKESDHKYLEQSGNYQWGQAIGLLVIAVLYALALGKLGFLLSTSGFLVAGAALLGERRFLVLVPVSVAATVFVWYLVDQVLTIFMRPWPIWLYG
ncbi:MAG: tripartite tricarboxylate transporter TctB family protein [SAR324 cluster bacterium]|nr:tripartite tricarboxylate transporter TctB family protein [SAR324 cluster bacterium]